MPLQPGTRLGAYQILSALGAGGMGEVYRARDVRLDRSVAIKVLPSEFASDAQLRLRFEREARSISRLTHPHICTLYDIGTQDGVDYLVMELLEGETLAERISRGPLPLADVVRYGDEIGEALEKAHRSGVVHRDLKPGNVMITRSGAKLLDFGLSVRRQSATAVEADATATQHKSLTAENTVVGTFQYMSPEQLSGDEVDHRSDLFSFGAVLYEMTTGRRAFPGKNRTSVVAAIMSSEPEPPSHLLPLIPDSLDRLVAWCLAKDPDVRIQSAHDVALQLAVLGEVAIHRQAKSPRAVWGLVALLAVVAMGAGVSAWRAHRTEPAAETRFNIPAPAGTNQYTFAAISPNGRRVVFRAGDAEFNTRLYLRNLPSTRSQALAGTEGAAFIFWAPDDRQIGFMARGKLLRVNVDTGDIRTVAGGITQGGGASWSKSGVILYSPRPESFLYRVNADGGNPVPETNLGATESHHIWPFFLPDGEHYLFTLLSSDQSQSGIYVGKLGSAERKRILPHRKRTDFTAAVYGGGHLFYVADFAVMAQKFDWKAQQLTDPPVKIDEGVELFGPGRTTLSSSTEGTFLFRHAGTPVVAQLFVADRTGREITKVGPEISYMMFSLSPDGRKLAYTREDPAPSVWILDVARGTVARAGYDQYSNTPQWLSDSRSYVFSATIDAPPNLMLARDGVISRLTNAFNQHYATAATPDDAWMFFNANVPTGYDIHAVSMTAPHKVVPVLTTPFNEYDARPSPDGKWLAFVSEENGAPQVFVSRWSPGTRVAPAASVQISTAPAIIPRWSKDGRELYFVDLATSKITAVNVSSEGDLQASIPEPLFAIERRIGFEPFPGGRFLVGRTRLNPDTTTITVVQGWGG